MKYLLPLFIWSIALYPAYAVQTPTQLTTTERTTRTVYISWNNIPSSNTKQFKYYWVKISQNGQKVSAEQHTEELSGKRTGLTIHRLEPNKRYTVKVQAVTRQGRSHWISKEFHTASGQSNIASPRFIDMEVHTNLDSASSSLDTLQQAMTSWNVSHLNLMPTPTALEDLLGATSENDIVDFVGNASADISVLYGGKKLNPILHALGGEATLTEESMFPNGTGSIDIAEALAATQAIAADPTGWETIFQNRAQTAAESGDYVGFGEIAGYHESQHAGQPFITAPLDDDLLLWLSDLAEDYDMFIQIHANPTAAKIEQLENLLDHNPNTVIVWTHPGWYHDDLATAQQYSDVMAAHDNLYLAIKLRTPDTFTAAYPLNKNGELRSQWETLLKTYANRIMISSDKKLWDEEGENISKSYRLELEPIQLMLDQLPSQVARQLAHGTAEQLLSLE